MFTAEFVSEYTCTQLISVLARRLMDLTLASILKGLTSPRCIEDELPTAATVECVAVTDDVGASEEDVDLTALPCAQVRLLGEACSLTFTMTTTCSHSCSLYCHHPDLIL